MILPGATISNFALESPSTTPLLPLCSQSRWRNHLTRPPRSGLAVASLHTTIRNPAYYAGQAASSYPGRVNTRCSSWRSRFLEMVSGELVILISANNAQVSLRHCKAPLLPRVELTLTELYREHSSPQDDAHIYSPSFSIISSSTHTRARLGNMQYAHALVDYGLETTKLVSTRLL